MTVTYSLSIFFFQTRFLSNPRGRNVRGFSWSFQSTIDPNTQIVHNTSYVFKFTHDSQMKPQEFTLVVMARDFANKCISRPKEEVVAEPVMYTHPADACCLTK